MSVCCLGPLVTLIGTSLRLSPSFLRSSSTLSLKILELKIFLILKCSVSKHDKNSYICCWPTWRNWEMDRKPYPLASVLALLLGRLTHWRILCQKGWWWLCLMSFLELYGWSEPSWATKDIVFYCIVFHPLSKCTFAVSKEQCFPDFADTRVQCIPEILQAQHLGDYPSGFSGLCTKWPLPLLEIRSLA